VPREPRGDKVARETLLGIFQSGAGGDVVVPFDADEGLPVAVPAGSSGEARDGDAVVAKRQRSVRRGGGDAASVIEVLGQVEAPGVDVEVVARRHHLRRGFPEAVRIHAARIARKIPDKELLKRERFDHPDPVTIDGETARDFDDAIAVEEAPEGGCRLYVHVADVSYYVKAGDPIDREAKERGTSVYFPDRVFPMVPERLADDLCSLRPGEDRLVQSVVIEFDKKGHAISSRFADGVIRSAARLTYTQVAEILDGVGARSPVAPEVAQMLRGAEVLRARLEARRRARGSIDFDLPAPMVLLDVEGVMTGIKIEPRNRAHRMIEEFMLAANEAVATWMSSHRVPCLFRIHESPDPLKIDGLAEFAKSLGLALRTKGGEIKPADVQRLLDEAEGMPAQPVLMQIALRSMKQARYAPEDDGHFGLAAPHYLHFTSPIRRYPDLVVHRLLRGLLTGQAGSLPTGLDAVAEECSQSERRAADAERELVEWKKTKFMMERVGEVFDGLVISTAKYGLFVELADLFVEGLVPIDTLPGDEYTYHENVRKVVGKRSRREFSIGDRVKVTLDRVDAAEKKLQFSLYEDEPKRSGGNPRRRVSHGAGRRAR
jgi:ribonuclease R